jgi:hypothetical protein
MRIVTVHDEWGTSRTAFENGYRDEAFKVFDDRPARRETDGPGVLVPSKGLTGDTVIWEPPTRVRRKRADHGLRISIGTLEAGRATFVSNSLTIVWRFTCVELNLPRSKHNAGWERISG